MAYTPILFPKKPGVSLQTIAPFPRSTSQKFFKCFIFSKSLLSFLTISNKSIYLTGLKKWVIQKSFLSSSDSFSDNTLIGIEDVFEETIDSFFLSLNIFSYILCLISILSTTASTIQSA